MRAGLPDKAVVSLPGTRPQCFCTFAPMDAHRLQRVEAQVQKDLAEIFREEAQQDFPGVLITVTSVRITPDLSLARLQLSTFPTDQAEAVMQWSHTHHKQLKNLLVRKMKGRLRKMPELQFFRDDSLEAESEIDRILRNGGESPIK